MRKSGELVMGVLRKYRLEAGFRRGRILDLWPRVSGAGLGRITEAVRFANGELFVRVQDAVAAHQLTYHRDSFIQRYAHQLGEDVVCDIRFETGSILQSREAPPIPRPPPPPLSLEATKALERILILLPEDLKPSAERLGRQVYLWLEVSGLERCPICSLPTETSPCEYCSRALATPLVQAAAKQLQQHPGHEPLPGDLLAAARYAAQTELMTQIRQLLPEAVHETRLRPLLRDLIQRYLHLKTGRENAWDALELLPPAAAQLLRKV